MHFDPGSPAGKEYAIPLDHARSIGSGNRTNHGSSSEPASQPFGSGIRRAAAVRPAAPQAPRRSTARRRPAAPRPPRATPRPAAPHRPVSYLSTVRSTDGPATPLVAGGSAAAVLLLAAALLALMRRTARSPGD